MAGKSLNSLGSKNWAPGSPSTRYNVSGKGREYYTFENAPGIAAYATGGKIVDGNDGYIYHIFTGDGIFQVNRPPAAIDSVDYLIVAGGGGTASLAPSGGGGGGGGFIFGNVSVTNVPGAYPIAVGAGGPDSPNPVSASPRNGSPSSAFGIISTGGGGGATSGPPVPLAIGAPGGSGGGGGNGVGGSGNTPPTIPRQGYSGGGASPTLTAGGGGGAGGSGNSGPAGLGGVGRIAPEFPSDIVKNAIPSPVQPSWQPLISTVGYSAGGSGQSGATPPGARTTPANSGYGGNPGGTSGGSGIVCIRYKKTAAYQRATGGTIEPSTHPEHPGVWRHIFTSPDNFTITDPTLQWIDYFAVGGGGGGGSSPGVVFSTPQFFGQGGYSTGGGGGAGGFVSSLYTSPTTPQPSGITTGTSYPWNPGYAIHTGRQMPIGVGTHPITVGAGGTSNTSGTNSIIGNPGPSQIIAYGGGAGGRAVSGQNGGSGGGAGKLWATSVGTAGAASPSPLTQGNPGGEALGYNNYNTNGSGGGGAGGVGGNSGGPVVPTSLGNGGVGWISLISPSSYGTPGPSAGYRYFAGGGGGGGGSIPFPPGATPPNTPLPGGTGGYGGGGAGGNSGNPGSPGTNGTTNTGGGGGGGGGNSPNPTNGGTGGPGIVIIQYSE